MNKNSKHKLRLTIGRNIRNLRLSRNISIEDIAELLELSPGFVGLVERGQRGLTTFNLKRLAEIFEISTDEIFADNTENDNYDSLQINETDKSSNYEKIKILLHNLSEKELKFIIETIANLKALREDANSYKEDTDYVYYTNSHSKQKSKKQK